MVKRKPVAPLGASLVVISSLFYASYGIWTTLMGNFFGGYTASALRSILVLVLFVPFAFQRKKFEPIHWKYNWHYLAGLLAVSFFIWGLLYYAILHAGIGLSLGVNYTMIVIGSLFLGWLFARERITREKVISVLIGIGGLTLIFRSSVGQVGWMPLIAVVVSGLASSVYNMIAKKMPYNATQSNVLIWTASVIANTIMAFAMKEAYPAVGWHMEWIYLVIFAVASVFASWTFVRGVQLIEVGTAGILGLLEIVFGVVFGVFFFSERPGLVVLFGMGMLIIAVAIPYIREYNPKKGTLDKR
ncbi:MAG: DMT family transporter [Nanoarchaeota archaeon]